MEYFCYNFDNWYRFYSFDFQKLVSMAIRVSNLGIYKISTFPLFSLSKITLKEFRNDLRMYLYFFFVW